MWYKLKRIMMRVNNTTRWLPAEYQEVEYIQTNWSQWIDTWLLATSNHQVETKIETASSESEKTIFGSLSYSNSSNSRNYYNLINYLNQWYWWTNWWEWHWWSFPSTAWVKYEIVFNNSNGKVVVDWNETWDCSWASGYSWSTLCLNARWGTNERYYWKYKFFYFKVYDKSNSEYVRDLVPCYRKADSVIWMYDLVNDVFYTNAWTWTFTKWNDVPDMVEKKVYPAW